MKIIRFVLAFCLLASIASCSHDYEAESEAFFDYDQPFVDTISGYEIDEKGNFSMLFENKERKQKWYLDITFRLGPDEKFLFRRNNITSTQENGKLTFHDADLKNLSKNDRRNLHLHFSLRNEDNWYLLADQLELLPFRIDTLQQVVPKLANSDLTFTRFDHAKYLTETDEALKEKIREKLGDAAEFLEKE
jgi:hypothetical protein